ncbi:glycosyltransferase [Thermus sp. 2.9]|uniref:glycosyltransferase n=1 Tax=Thermus sp. (strain 2.9) TaxID=1577051 RepID=UPI00190F5859|nr:glycosyltransferase [Thermus sp. 2.9]
MEDFYDSLLIVGQGSLEGVLRRLIAKHRLEDKVFLLGSRSDVPELMNMADAYVMSSAWEGMPMVLLEAHASGLPVVATKVGGNPEVVRDGVSGFLVPPGDAPALARAMYRLMMLTPTEREDMGARGRRWVEEAFSFEKVIKEWENLYLKLLRSKAII